MNKIFITGANGFIGNKLANKLANEGELIHAFVRNSKSAINLLHPNITVFEGDLKDPDTLRSAMEGCDRVYHIAGFAKLWAKNRDVFYEVNVRGTEKVLDAALDAGVKKLVYTSSAAIFGPSLKLPLCESDPRTIGFDADYDLSKYLAEAKVKEYVHKGLFTVIVNPTRVYGPGQISHSNAISQMLLQCLKGRRVVIPGCKDIKSNYAFIDDVVEGHIYAMNKGLGGEKYILGGENLSYNEVLLCIRELLKVKAIPLSPSLIKLWGWVELMKGRFLDCEPLYTPSTIGRYLVNAEFNCQKAKRQLGYKITPFSEGIKRTISFLTASYG